LMNPITDFLDRQGVLILDGAMATELEKLGADLDDPLWSAKCLIESPQLIQQVHTDYLNAGADVITTATYQASVRGFQNRGMTTEEAQELIRRGVSLAIQARDEFWSNKENRSGRLKPLVAASVGPFGAVLHDGSEYHGNYSAGWQEVGRFHRDRLEILADCQADILAFETIPSLPEAETLLNLLSHWPEQTAWLAFSCRDNQHTSHGELLSDCVKLADAHPQIASVGINCTAPNHISPLLESLQHNDLPLLVYPNSGEDWVAQDNSWKGQGSDIFPVGDWYEAGARLIGGCCRTAPADISRLRVALQDKFNVAMPSG
jgi:homocysteine S-methyltransferase